MTGPSSMSLSEIEVSYAEFTFCRLMLYGGSVNTNCTFPVRSGPIAFLCLLTRSRKRTLQDTEQSLITSKSRTRAIGPASVAVAVTEGEDEATSACISAETAAEEDRDFERISVDAWGLAGRLADASDLRLTPPPKMKGIFERQ
jgi:hypothetical protein